jgi:hypothetical protein
VFAARAAFALDESIPSSPIDEFNGTVMSNSQVLRKRTNGRLDIRRKPSDREHQLVLSGFNSGSLGCAVTEVQIVVNAPAEIG